jgi:ribosome biogenesis SPOUT family RNA methylase Rps3
MKNSLYTALGYVTWEGIKLVVRRKLGQKQVKIGAAATVALVLIGGLAIAKATATDDE